MDINNFRWWLDIAPWLFGLVGYVALVVVVYCVVYHIFGRKPMIWTIRIMAFPVWLPVYAVVRLARKLARIKTSRLLKETFGIADWENFPANTVLISSTLAELAASLDLAFRREVMMFNHPVNKQGLAEAREDVRYAKARFWKAHALAKENGYYVHRTYKEHLSGSAPTSGA